MILLLAFNILFNSGTNAFHSWGKGENERFTYANTDWVTKIPSLLDLSAYPEFDFEALTSCTTQCKSIYSEKIDIRSCQMGCTCDSETFTTTAIKFVNCDGYCLDAKFKSTVTQDGYTVHPYIQYAIKIPGEGTTINDYWWFNKGPASISDLNVAACLYGCTERDFCGQQPTDAPTNAPTDAPTDADVDSSSNDQETDATNTLDEYFPYYLILAAVLLICCLVCIMRRKKTLERRSSAPVTPSSTIIEMDRSVLSETLDDQKSKYATIILNKISVHTKPEVVRKVVLRELWLDKEEQPLIKYGMDEAGYLIMFIATHHQETIDKARLIPSLSVDGTEWKVNISKTHNFNPQKYAKRLFRPVTKQYNISNMEHVNIQRAVENIQTVSRAANMFKKAAHVKSP